MTSMAPGQMATPEALVSPAQLAAASDVALAHTVAAVLAEQHRRAVSGGDVEALLEQAFVEGFTGRGEAGTPWVDGGLLFCPGMIKYKSATSHDCTFVSIDGRWVWEHDHLRDEMRQVPGPRVFKQSVTILPVLEGSKVDMVTSASRSGGPCAMRKARSFQVRGGALVEVATRARAPQGHR